MLHFLNPFIKLRVTAGHPDGKWTSYLDQSLDAKQWWKLYTAVKEPSSEDGLADGNVIKKCTKSKTSFEAGEGNKCSMKIPGLEDESTSQIWGGSRYKTKMALLTYFDDLGK